MRIKAFPLRLCGEVRRQNFSNGFGANLALHHFLFRIEKGSHRDHLPTFIACVSANRLLKGLKLRSFR